MSINVNDQHEHLNTALSLRLLEGAGFRSHNEVYAAFPPGCPVMYTDAYVYGYDTNAPLPIQENWYKGIIQLVIPAETIEQTGGWKVIIRMEGDRPSVRHPYDLIALNLLHILPGSFRIAQGKCGLQVKYDILRINECQPSAMPDPSATIVNGKRVDLQKLDPETRQFMEGAFHFFLKSLNE